MKVYCLYDNARRKYYRSVFDSRDVFTSKPSQLSSNKDRLERDRERLKVNWSRYGHAMPLPRFVVKEFEIDLTPETSHATH